MKHELDTTKGRLQEVKHDLQRYVVNLFVYLQNNSCPLVENHRKSFSLLIGYLQLVVYVNILSLIGCYI